MIFLALAWNALVQQLFPVFTPPTTQIFLRLTTGWILCTSRRTITGMIPFVDPARLRAHDTYHRFFSRACWNPIRWWEFLARLLVRVFYPRGVMTCDLDDTLFHHCGRKMDGVGFWRDAVRSTGQKTVYGWGLNLVVLTLQVTPPWGEEPLGLLIPLLLRPSWIRGQVASEFRRRVNRLAMGVVAGKNYFDVRKRNRTLQNFRIPAARPGTDRLISS